MDEHDDNPQDAGADTPPDALDDALLPRIAMIEASPLAQRAAAYSQLHQELSTTLAAADSAGSPS